MSQHLFPVTLSGGQRATVLTGYDRPLNGFFMTVELVGSEHDDEPPFYSNLDDWALAHSGGMARSMSYFADHLKVLGAAIPESVLREVNKDARERVGNRHVEYDESGAELVAA